MVIRGNKGSYIIPSPSPIPDGGYLALSVGDIQEERGGVTSLIDLVKSASQANRSGADSVHYGQQGSAPLPPAGMSLSRAPDASAGAPPPPDPDLDGLVWTIDPTPTFGWANDAPQPQMGQPFLMNELNPGIPGGSDMIEFYNPSTMVIDAGGWVLMNGDSYLHLNGLVLPGDFLVMTTPAGFDLEEVGLLYLFRSDGVRVDQLGFHDAPPLGNGQCYARCPDGAPPYLGYDYAASGGGTTFLPLNCTYGAPNSQGCVGGAEDGPPRKLIRWGRLKHEFR